MKSTTKKVQLLEEEQSLLESLEKGSWKPVKDSEKKRILALVGQKRNKEARINVRLSQPDLTALQMRAAREGLPYQTLLASVVHKYVTGQLVPV